MVFLSQQLPLSLTELRYIPQRSSNETEVTQEYIGQLEEFFSAASCTQGDKNIILSSIVTSFSISNLFKVSENSALIKGLLRQDKFAEQWQQRLENMGHKEYAKDSNPFTKLMGCFLLYHLNEHVKKDSGKENKPSAKATELCKKTLEYLPELGQTAGLVAGADSTENANSLPLAQISLISSCA